MYSFLSQSIIGPRAPLRWRFHQRAEWLVEGKALERSMEATKRGSLARSAFALSIAHRASVPVRLAGKRHHLLLFNYHYRSLPVSAIPSVFASVLSSFVNVYGARVTHRLSTPRPDDAYFLLLAADHTIAPCRRDTTQNPLYPLLLNDETIHQLPRILTTQQRMQ